VSTPAEATGNNYVPGAGSTGVGLIANPVALNTAAVTPATATSRAHFTGAPNADYSGHREMQTNSHIAMIAQSFSLSRGQSPVETQVGWNSQTRRLVIAQNDQDSAKDLLRGLKDGSALSYALTAVKTPTLVLGSPQGEAGGAAKKLLDTYLGIRGHTASDNLRDLKTRKRQIDALARGHIDVVVRGQEPHAELQIEPLIPPRNREEIAGTKLRCALCALEIGAQSTTAGNPTTGLVFPGTAKPSARYATRTLNGSTEQQGTGFTRAYSLSPRR
jgi:hypothetical protein